MIISFNGKGNSGGARIWSGTQEDYDDLPEIDGKTLYIILPSPDNDDGGLENNDDI